MDPDEITDVEQRIAFRSMREMGNLSTYECAMDVLLLLDSTLKFLKKFEDRTVGKILKIITESTGVLGNYKEIDLTALSLRRQVLELIAERHLERTVVFHMGKRNSMQISLIDSHGTVKYIDPIEISLSLESNKVQQSISDRLEIILKQEAKKDWDKIMKAPIGKGLLRQGDIKGWPIIKDYIYVLYSILYPIYPARAHMYKREKWEKQKAKYPDALSKDIMQLLKEKFPEDFKNLKQEDVESCIQYRLELGNKKRSSFLNEFFLQRIFKS